MSNCHKCIRENVCPKAKHIENYKIKSKCSEFIDSDWREILSELSHDQICELMKYANSLRENNK